MHMLRHELRCDLRERRYVVNVMTACDEANTVVGDESDSYT